MKAFPKFAAIAVVGAGLTAWGCGSTTNTGRTQSGSHTVNRPVDNPSGTVTTGAPGETTTTETTTQSTTDASRNPSGAPADTSGAAPSTSPASTPDAGTTPSTTPKSTPRAADSSPPGTKAP